MTQEDDITYVRGDSMAEYSYTVYFEPLSEGGYNVSVPAIPEICTFGESLKDARAMVSADAIHCYSRVLSNTANRSPQRLGS